MAPVAPVCAVPAVVAEAAATTFQSLAGQLLVAMPALADYNFSRTVTLVCEHNEHGALGVVVNRPLDMTLDEVLQQFALSTTDELVAGAHVYHGGPVQTERGFVIHDGNGDFEGSLRIGPDLAVTTSRDVLEAIAAGSGPTRVLVALGYAGWAGGQLEHEMAENSWLSVPVDAGILFDVPAAERWTATAGLLGIDLRLLNQVGHA